MRLSSKAGANIIAAAALAAIIGGAAESAHAQLTGFVVNETSNSIDFTNFVTALGSTIDTSINFDTQPTGALQPNFYPGVTLTPSGDVNTISFGSGPGDTNTSSAPLSPGEGLHPASNFLFDDSGASTLTISFAAPVNGFGLFVIDYFDPNLGENLTLEAFTGANGTGVSLGSFSAEQFNFQTDNRYFMGLATTNGAALIGSVVFTDIDGGTGDRMGLDDFRISRISGSTTAAPEPGTTALMATGLLSLAGIVLRRRRCCGHK